MSEVYKRKIGPATAMSALEPEFQSAYAAAIGKLVAAVLEFERVTGRVVDDISLGYIDVTVISDAAPRKLRTASMDFLPTPAEIDW